MLLSMYSAFTIHLHQNGNNALAISEKEAEKEER